MRAVEMVQVARTEAEKELGGLNPEARGWTEALLI